MFRSDLEGRTYDIASRNRNGLEEPKIENNPEIVKMIESANNIKLSADWHLWKVNRQTRTYERGDRLERTIEECKDLKENDLLIFMGDLVDDEFDDYQSVEKVLNTIKSNKIMILGNNDLFENDFYERNFDIVVEGFEYEDLIFTHFPILDLTEKVNLHGHIHNSAYYFPERAQRNINIFTESGDFMLLDDLQGEIERRRK